MKLTCTRCKKIVTSISIVKHLTFRADYDSVNGFFSEVDREYLGPDNAVRALVYTCDCYPNGVEFNFRMDDHIQDFVRDIDQIQEGDLQHKRYGTLIVTKE
jgi:hypothetical protein